MKTQIQGSHQTQKMIFLFLLCYILLSLFAIHAEAVTIASGTCGDNLTWKLDSGKLTISGTGAMTDYDYASSPWYYKNSSIVKVVIENNVTSIGDSAFPDCDQLTSITIPNSVTSIGEEAFGHCSSLTNIIVDSGNKFYCSVNGVLLKKLNNTDKNLICYPAGKTDNAYTIPNNVTSIEYYAFAGCSNLTSIAE